MDIEEQLEMLTHRPNALRYLQGLGLIHVNANGIFEEVTCDKPVPEIEDISANTPESPILSDWDIVSDKDWQSAAPSPDHGFIQRWINRWRPSAAEKDVRLDHLPPFCLNFMMM